MRWYEISSRILLILSVVNFALAAPVAIRDIHGVRVDMADIAKDGTGVSQSQTRGFDPWAQWSTTNAADRTSAPPSPDPVDSEHTEHGFAQLPPTSPATSSVASNSVPSSPTAPNNWPSSPGSESPSWPHGPGGASPEYEYGISQTHGASWNSEWDSDRMTLSEQYMVDPDNPATSLTVDGPPARDHSPSSPAPSTGPPPSADGSPSPSPGPDVNPPPSSELQHPAEHESESFLESLLRGKIRRHISGPVAVHAAQMELSTLPRMSLLLSSC